MSLWWWKNCFLIGFNYLWGCILLGLPLTIRSSEKYTVLVQCVSYLLNWKFIHLHTYLVSYNLMPQILTPITIFLAVLTIFTHCVCCVCVCGGGVTKLKIMFMLCQTFTVLPFFLLTSYIIKCMNWRSLDPSCVTLE